MNLAQMKTALENNVVQKLQISVDQKVDITASYDANSGSMVVEMTETKPEQNGRSSKLCYTIRVVEETKITSIIAFNRVYMHDSLGIVLVNNEPIAITSDFMNSITNIILLAMDEVYHPENYQPVEAVEELSQPAIEDGNTE